MRLLFLRALFAVQLFVRPAIQILIGLFVLSFAIVSPGIPACTGMALVALGATTATAERFRQSYVRGPLLMAHAVVYAALYFLFVGSSLDQAFRGPGISLSVACDFAASIPLVVAAAGVVAAACRNPESTEY